MTVPVTLDASGARQLAGGYDEFDGFLWLVARRDFQQWFVMADGGEKVIGWPAGKLALLIGPSPGLRWECVIKDVNASLHVLASEVAKVQEGWPWSLVFEHTAGATEVVAEGFCRIQDGCSGVSKPLLPA